MTKKNKPIIDKYIQPIFTPTTVYVAKYVTVEDLNKKFECISTNTSFEEIFKNGYAACVITVKDREANMDVSLVIIFEELLQLSVEDQIGICAHEALHVSSDILTNCGIKHDESTEEVYAYMTDWATRCIYKTLFNV